MKKKHAYIAIEFKKEPCEGYCSPFTNPNRLLIMLQPTADMYLELNAKVHTESFALRTERLLLSDKHAIHSSSDESYALLLKDCVKGDRTLFTRYDELQAAWKIVDRVERLRKRVVMRTYKYGKAPSAFV
jgi:glucose-6-phosphate 1-dehydrogenase